MADQLPLNFAIPSESAIVTYPYEDISEGIGRVKYNLMSIEDASAESYIMTRDTLYSNTIDPGRDVTPNEVTTWDFDLAPFNTPKIVKGTALFNFNTYFDKEGVGASNMVFEIEVYHYDGSTATQIGSSWTVPTMTSSGGDVKRELVTAQIELPLTKFKIGEIIRVAIVATKTGDASDSAEWRFGCDPMNRDGSKFTPSVDPSEFTTNQAWIPYLIQE